MSYASVVLTERGHRRLLTGHPWIYKGDISSVESAESGDIVSIRDSRGRHAGFAFYSATSLIALRIISHEDEPDRSLFRRRIEKAIELRRLLYAQRSMERVVHGESDGLPSLIVDRYEDVLVIQTLSAGAERIKEMIVELLCDLLSPRTIIERNDPSVRKLEGLQQISTLVKGEAVTEVWCREGGQLVKVSPLTGQKTGLFLDQQENHEAAAAYARGRVLDAFAYQGGFALQVAKNAAHVTSVDSSAEALHVLKENCHRNGLTHIDTIEANVFDHLTERYRMHATFDMVILDPPAFAKNRGSLAGALRGYKEINLRAMSLLEPGGILMTSSCSYHLSEERLLMLLAEAAADLGRHYQIIEKRTQARDHPILLSMPESYYLKCIVLRMM